MIDAASSQARPATLALLAETVSRQARAGCNPKVLLLGGSDLEQAAAAGGLTDRCRASLVGVPLGRAELGPVAIHKALPPTSDLEMIYAWSAGAWAVVRWLRRRGPRVLCVIQPPDKAMWRAIAHAAHDRADGAATSSGRGAAVLALDPVLGHKIIAAISKTHPQAYDGSGDPQRSGAQGMVVWPGAAVPLPGFVYDAHRNDQAKVRSELRRLWGSDQAKAGEFVVALLSAPPEAADTRRALLTLGVMREALVSRQWHPPNMALVVHPNQYQRAPAMRTSAIVSTPVRLIQDSNIAAPWRIMPGCDVAMEMDPDGGGLGVAAAMGAGKPVVVPDTPRQRLRLTHQHTGLLAHNSSPQRLAAELQRLVQDPALADRLGASACAEHQSLDHWFAAVDDAAARVRQRRGGNKPVVAALNT